MALVQINFTDEEEEIISKLKKKHNLKNKPVSVKKIIELYWEVVNKSNKDLI